MATTAIMTEASDKADARLIGASAVLRDRRRLLTNRCEKEWWFSYCLDESAGLYVSWSFLRAWFADHFAFYAFDIGQRKTWFIRRTMFLDSLPGGREWRLAKTARDYSVCFEDLDDALHFRYGSRGMEADLMIGPSPWPVFEKHEHQSRHRYHVDHTYRNPVIGSISLEGAVYRIRTNRTYFDHCSGNVPSHSAWHWIAVQGDRTALTSLVNYGPWAQRYTQVFLNGDWCSLSPEVAFNHDPGAPARQWRVTSADLDLTVDILGRHVLASRIPPLVPFLVRIDHAESVVRVMGRVRVDGAWQEVRDLCGVMEEHRGRW